MKPVSKAGKNEYAKANKYLIKRYQTSERAQQSRTGERESIRKSLKSNLKSVSALPLVNYVTVNKLFDCPEP